MATPSYHNPSIAGRQYSPSARPRGRDSKDIPCRNISMHGSCKREGCPYNHSRQANMNSSNNAIGNVNKRLNVDSPAFTPGAPGSGSRSTSGVQSTGISPKLAIAAPFTPKSSKIVPATNVTPPVTRDQSADWGGQDIPEFVPGRRFGVQQQEQHYASSEQQMHGVPNDPFPSYDGSSPYLDGALTVQEHQQQVNPYLQNNTGASQGGFYGQQQSAFAQPLHHHLYFPQGPRRDDLKPYQRSPHDLFIAEELRQEIQRKMDAAQQTLPNSNLPPTVAHYHSLVPLDMNNQKNSTAIGYLTWTYKAESNNDGYAYTLRRIEGFRPTSSINLQYMNNWKTVLNPNIVTLHEIFTTQAFGEICLVFVTDYHPLSKTLAELHFTPTPTRPGGRQQHQQQQQQQHNQFITEQTLWNYIVQLTSALRALHTTGLAARLLTPSKLIISSNGQLRLNVCGILDVVRPMELIGANLLELQTDDLRSLGLLMLSLGTKNLGLSQASSPLDQDITSSAAVNKALDTFGRTYSPRLRNTVASLLYPSQETNSHDITAFASTITDHILNGYESSMQALTESYDIYARELQNGRAFRSTTKIDYILERPDMSSSADGPSHQNAGNSTGANSGGPDRIDNSPRNILRLFREFVFHPVSAGGVPIVSLTHVLTHMNKMDAGTEEKIRLTTKEAGYIVLVTYRDVRRCLELCWNEVVAAGQGGPVMPASAR